MDTNDPRRWPRDVNSGGVYGNDGERLRMERRHLKASARRKDDEGAWGAIGNFFGIGPKGYRRSDERIYDDVCDALMRHPAVDASGIEVTVKDAVVTLSGTVTSRRAKRDAEDALEGIPGLRDVMNALEVGSSKSTIATDSAVPG